MYLIGFPLLVIPFAVYNIIEFLMPGAAPGEDDVHRVRRLALLEDQPPGGQRALARARRKGLQPRIVQALEERNGVKLRRHGVAHGRLWYRAN